MNWNLRGSGMKKREGLKSKIIIGLAIALILVLFISYNKISLERQTDLMSSKVEENIIKLVELSTVKYNYTNIVEYKNNIQLKGLDIPFTNKKFIVKYSGYIKAGIDLETLEIKVDDKNTIRVSMDKPKIIENIISEEDVYFFDEKDSIFNKLSFKDLYSVLIDEKEKMKEEALEKGLLNDAEKNGKEIIKSFLEGIGFKSIKIEFK